MDIRSPVLVILCGGSPAPGINGVISSVVIEALNSGLQVVGVFDGWKHIKTGVSDFIHYFSMQDVSSLHDQPGAFLRMSRHQLESEQDTDNALRVLQLLRAKYLVTIGGTETAHSAYMLAAAAKAANTQISLAHVPKTIFNDLPLPPDAVTFGYSTARDTGVALVNSLRVDARTLNKYYFVTIKGRRAGRLALGIGKAAAATAVLIPEEFEKGTSFDHVVDTVLGLILKRHISQRDYGVIILAEGLVDLLDPKDIANLFDGHEEEARHDFNKILLKQVMRELEDMNLDIGLGSRYIGSELRSALPNPNDVELARDLGYGAVQFLLEGGSGSLITLKGGFSHSIPLEEIMDFKRGLTQIRYVDLRSNYYEVALKYQIRLTKKDLEDSSFLHAVEDKLGISPQDFISRFSKVVC